MKYLIGAWKRLVSCLDLGRENNGGKTVAHPHPSQHQTFRMISTKKQTTISKNQHEYIHVLTIHSPFI